MFETKQLTSPEDINDFKTHAEQAHKTKRAATWQRYLQKAQLNGKDTLRPVQELAKTQRRSWASRQYANTAVARIVGPCSDTRVFQARHHSQTTDSGDTMMNSYLTLNHTVQT